MDHKHFVSQLFSSYQQVKQRKLTKLQFDSSDAQAVKQLLETESDHDALLHSWAGFLRTEDPFHRKQHNSHPVRFWVRQCYRTYMLVPEEISDCEWAWPTEEEIAEYEEIARIVVRETADIGSAFLRAKRQFEILEEHGLSQTTAFLEARKRV